MVVASANLGVPTNVTRTSNMLGRDNWNDPFFGGNMDEVAFYRKPLSAGQVQKHFAASGGSVARLDEPARIATSGR